MGVSKNQSHTCLGVPIMNKYSILGSTGVPPVRGNYRTMPTFMFTTSFLYVPCVYARNYSLKGVNTGLVGGAGFPPSTIVVAKNDSH